MTNDIVPRDHHARWSPTTRTAFRFLAVTFLVAAIVLGPVVFVQVVFGPDPASPCAVTSCE